MVKGKKWVWEVVLPDSASMTSLPAANTRSAFAPRCRKWMDLLSPSLTWHVCLLCSHVYAFALQSLSVIPLILVFETFLTNSPPFSPSLFFSLNASLRIVFIYSLLSTFMKNVPLLWAVTSVSKMIWYLIYLLCFSLTEPTAFCKVNALEYLNLTLFRL